MKRLRLAILLCVFAATFALAAEKVGLADLAKDPKKFDGKVIETSGVVSEFKQKTSRAGNKYFTFVLAQGKEEKVNVFSQGEADSDLKDGVKAKVVGLYRIEKKLGTMTFKNEVDATKVKDKPNGVSVLPKE